MIPSYKIGKTRIELAKILTTFCGINVPPALLIKNTEDYRNGRNFGWAFSWYVDVSPDHPLYGCGSGETMTDFVRCVRQGCEIELRKEELFLVR